MFFKSTRPSTTILRHLKSVSNSRSNDELRTSFHDLPPHAGPNFFGNTRVHRRLPYAGVTIDRGGRLYGTTSEYPGTVYEMKPVNGNWSFSTIFTFNIDD
jgi:hypothetical protein